MGVTATRWNRKSHMQKLGVLLELGLKYTNARAFMYRDYDDLPPRLRLSVSAKLRKKPKRYDEILQREMSSAEYIEYRKQQEGYPFL